MKSGTKRSTYKAIYRLLDKVTPVDYDCGLICGAACCTCEKNDQAGDDEMGIYLLPGEEKLFTGREEWLEWNAEYAEDYDFPDSWHGKIYFLRCKTPPVCDRDMRPLQCRFYPLAPHINREGELEIILNTLDLPYICPLINENRKKKDCPDRFRINDDFAQAVYTVWKHLIRDPLIYDLVIMDSDDRIEAGYEITVIKHGITERSVT